MLPRIILHNAVSIDGRTDWIDPDLGQFYEIASRWREDATLAGSDRAVGHLGLNLVHNEGLGVVALAKRKILPGNFKARFS